MTFHNISCELKVKKLLNRRKMAHRRKSSHPLCKQKRISSVVDRVLAAKLQENEKKKEVSFEIKIILLIQL